jgi:hypothetical protein
MSLLSSSMNFLHVLRRHATTKTTMSLTTRTLSSTSSSSTFGFQIEAAYAFHFSKDIANEFLEVYREVYPSYVTMLDHICSSPVLVLAITATGDFPGMHTSDIFMFTYLTDET